MSADGRSEAEGVIALDFAEKVGHDLRPTGASVAERPLLELRTAGADLLDIAARLRAGWPTLPPAQVQAELLAFERDVAELLTKAVRVADGLIALDRSEGGPGPSAAAARSMRSQLERDAGRLEREAVARDRSAAALLWHLAARLRMEAAEDRKRAGLLLHQAGLERSATRTDSVTGALNRSQGLAALEQEVERCRRGDGRLVLGFLDVDALKEVNDAGGHHAGDDLLRHVARVVKSTLRPYDVVVRYGGDEFVYSLAGVGVSAAMNRFKKASAVLAEVTGGRTVSVGFAALRPGESLASLIARADAELYARRRLTRTPRAEL